jgi:5'-methylthioadenosine phosphorylase
MWAIIGGSGFENFEDFHIIEELDTNTPFGEASSGLKRVKLGETELIFLSRHGNGHELTPTGINYQANIFALKKYGVTKILSVSAVGSLREELKPGDMVITSQYIDRTKGIRKHTFSEKGVVAHCSLAYPVSGELTEAAKTLISELDFDVHTDKTYVCMEGPAFSTFAESSMYRQLNADIIGMTNFPEYALAREAGIGYLPCCFVTDYDCWNVNAPHATLPEIINTMRLNNSKACSMALKLVTKFKDIEVGTKAEGFQTGLMSSIEMMSPEQKSWVEVLKS